ncbi:MAG TPA: DUF779 domain-containing protein [Desulfobacteraceae bacterium]|nr:MAG: hypothetical protein DRQ97_02875 [Gammaproteobacteria bacterium]HHE74017.1 DUF779 domain-containing protein [Desulfobacteraceae bacterium]
MSGGRSGGPPPLCFAVGDLLVGLYGVRLTTVQDFYFYLSGDQFKRWKICI